MNISLPSSSTPAKRIGITKAETQALEQEDYQETPSWLFYGAFGVISVIFLLVLWEKGKRLFGTRKA